MTFPNDSELLSLPQNRASVAHPLLNFGGSVQASVIAEEMKSEEIFVRTFFSPNHNIKIASKTNNNLLPAMTSINDSISPDLLFNIFKQLDCIQTTIVRRVCKQWWEIIDEHKSFWRTLHLPEKSLKRDPSILELFDQKSGSTLQEVEVRVPVKGELLQQQLFDLLKKSNKSLEHLLVNFPWHEKTHSQKIDFLEAFPHVKSLIVLPLDESSKVRLRRRNVQDPDAASPLKVLWCNHARTLFGFSLVRFQNLVSLEIEEALSPSVWRKFLEGPSKTLKHLRIGCHVPELEAAPSPIPALDFPKLEVLHLNAGFPRWFRFPVELKLLTGRRISNVPSISELWLWDLIDHRDCLVNRCPILKVLQLNNPSFDWNSLLNVLNRRKVNVEAGLEVDGVKMEVIGKLVLPFSLGDSSLSEDTKNLVERCRELVEVVEGDAQSRFIEIEV